MQPWITGAPVTYVDAMSVEYCKSLLCLKFDCFETFHWDCWAQLGLAQIVQRVAMINHIEAVR